MRKGIQPALEQYLVTAGGGEGAAVVAAAAAASMDKRALLASPGGPPAKRRLELGESGQQYLSDGLKTPKGKGRAALRSPDSPKKKNTV